MLAWGIFGLTLAMWGTWSPAEPSTRPRPDEDPAAVQTPAEPAAPADPTEEPLDEPRPESPAEPDEPGSVPTDDPAPDSPDEPPTSPQPDQPGSFFNQDALAPEAEPAEPESGRPGEGDNGGTAPPMPVIEELPAKTGPLPSGDRGRRRGGLFGGDPARPPAGAEGGSFFDPGKLADTGPGGGALQIRGFVAANFFVTERTDTQRRDADGNLRRLDPLAFFDLRSATLYVGAPIYADVIYARIGVEFIAIPNTQTSTNFDILSQSRRFVFFETGALEINPFAWAENTGRWFREGFKLTAGVFIVPFGLEDEDHAAPVNWFITRALSMTNGRVYPGTWNDVGATLKWKPTFRPESPIRPVEIDLGVVNGDACTQTRFQDELFSPTGQVARCERRLRQEELAEAMAYTGDGTSQIDAPGGVVLPDNNGGKSVFTRAQFFALPTLNFGGSFVWGTHPEGGQAPELGQTTAELEQAPSWRVGAHLDVNFEEMFDTKFPLPALRGEFVYGVDEAVDREGATQTDRRMMGGYIQAAQILFRRKKTRLPGLILQYRFDHADPDLNVPGTGRNGVALVSDVASGIFLRETAIQSHTVGLRLPVLPRFTLKAEYQFALEDGGRRNQLHNDLFGFEAVADF